MKILHTSDWHLGHLLYKYDRQEEQSAMLQQIEKIIRQELPDAMVVSGDIFDTSTPGNRATRLFYDAIMQMSDACPTMQIVITAGNHDSSTRLEVGQTLCDRLGITVIGNIQRDEAGEVDLDRHIVEVRDGNGKPIGLIVAIPYIYPLSYPILDANAPREHRQQIFYTRLMERVQLRNVLSLPVVMMAHLSASAGGTNCDITGHDERGGIDYVEVETLGSGYDYLALGHIHCPQTLGPTSRVRYCGSPLAISFAEQYEHSITIADLPTHGAVPQLRTIRIRNPWPLITVPSDGSVVTYEEALQQLRQMPADRKAYICLRSHIDDIAPVNYREMAEQAKPGPDYRICHFEWLHDTSADDQRFHALTVEELQTIQPIEMAQKYYQDKFNAPMPPEMTEVLEEAFKAPDSVN